MGTRRDSSATTRDRARRREPRIGRPPAGARPGERVTDYPQVSMRLPVEIRDSLRDLSAMRSQPQWRIVCDAIGCYLRDLPAAERRRLAAGKAGRRPR
jgi:hypothetical protein